MTTIKKRTMMQPQFAKSKKLVAECKDTLFSTLQISDGKVVFISGE
jgi:hypothetical protein